MREKWDSLVERVVDRICPRITGQRERFPTDIEFTLEGSEDVLLKAEEYAHALAAKAEEREISIDRKLFSLFSLSSVASSVMIAVLIGAATITVPDATTVSQYLVIPRHGTGRVYRLTNVDHRQENCEGPGSQTFPWGQSRVSHTRER